MEVWAEIFKQRSQVDRQSLLLHRVNLFMARHAT